MLQTHAKTQTLSNFLINISDIYWINNACTKNIGSQITRENVYCAVKVTISTQCDIL